MSGHGLRARYVAVATILLSGCAVGTPEGARLHGVGGTVVGLAGTGLVLQNNGGDDVVVASNGRFWFVTPLEEGRSYAVTVALQPTSPSQTCTVTGGSGVVGNVDVASVLVTCVTRRRFVGGTVTGLEGAGLVLRNEGGDDLAVTSNGSFAFATPVAEGGSYAVTVAVQPSGPSQTCTVSGGSGVVGAADVASAVVTCVTDRYAVGGTVTGLAGAGLVLRNLGGDDLAIASNGSFTFGTTMAVGGSYAVAVAVQPTGPSQTCTVAGGEGVVGTADVTSVAVTCVTERHAVGGTVAGLAGTGLVLQNLGGDDLAIASNGSFTFGTTVAEGGSYSVAVAVQPTGPSQTCTVAGGDGVVGTADVTSVVLTCRGPVLYLSAMDATHGLELWRSDGTTPGTVLVKDIRPGFAYSDPGPLLALGDALYFFANDGTNGPALWTSDGTAAGTLMVEDVEPGTDVPLGRAVMALGGAIYFSANDGVHGSELWKTDGTSAGTVLVADINPGPGGSGTGLSGPSAFTAFEGTLAFLAYEPTHGLQLWRSDGTAGGTARVTDVTFNTGLGIGTFDGFTYFGGSLYFRGAGATGSEPWKTDGSAAGASLLKDIVPGSAGSNPASFTPFAGALYFSADDGTGNRLWKTDGTNAGTVRVDASCSQPMSLVAFGGALYFSATDGTHGRELWRTDGTAAGTSLVADLNPGPGDSTPAGFTEFGGALFFAADDGTHGVELWRTDGTAGGTALVSDIDPGAEGSSPMRFKVFDGALYFCARDGSGMWGLWRTDGTAAGTVLVASVTPFELAVF